MHVSGSQSRGGPCANQASGGGSSGLTLQFTVSGGSAPYSASVTATSQHNGTGDRGGVQLLQCFPRRGCDTEIFLRQSDQDPRGSLQGTLAQGTYQFGGGANCGASSSDSTPHASCSASLDYQLDVGVPFTPVSIDSKPPALTTEKDALFAFHQPDNPPPGVLECALDSLTFTQCESPKTFSSLSDGEHTFRVRYHPDGQQAGDATSHTWVVDTAKPQVVIDDAPEGNANPPDDEIAFHSTEPTGANFRCKLDNGTESSCSSPRLFSGLAPGTHTFTVVAIDAAGNESQPVSVTWGVGTPVVIGSGPSGLGNSRVAQFQFTLLDPDPAEGKFECQLDGFGFVECESPKTFTNLPDGPHTIRVRFDPDGDEPPSLPAERTWTVDATKPDVGFDSAPSGDVESATAEFQFQTNEPDGAAFRCQLDTGADFNCASPHIERGLSDGPHTFTVVAVDRAGNESSPATASWTVVPVAGPPVAGCTAAGAAPSFGPVRIVPRTADSCFFDDTFNGAPVRASRGQVSLNGITLTPAPGTRIIVAPLLADGSVLTDGPVTVTFGLPPKPGEFNLSVTLDRLELDRLATSVSLANKVLAVDDSALKLAGMDVRPGLGIELTPDNGGQTKVSFKFSFPDNTFSTLPNAKQTVTTEMALTLSNDKGVTGGAKVKLSNIFMFGLRVKDLELGYDHATGVLDGSVGVKLGASDEAPVLTLSLSIGVPELVGGLNCGFRKLGLAVSDVNKPIAAGVKLQRFGGAFECISDGGGDLSAKLTASGGVSVGPKIDLKVFEAEAVSVDGTASLTVPVTSSGPFTFEASGAGKVVDIPVSSQTVTFTSPASIKLTGALDITGGGFGAQLTYGEQGTFVTPDAFNIEAAGTASLFGLSIGANAVFSSKGFAVCIGKTGEKVGFGRAWGGTLTAFTVCDVGPFRALAPAQAGDGFTVGAGRPLTVVAAEGDGAPPKLVLTGPGGERVETPAGPEGISTNDVLLVQDTERNTTFVALFNPAAGDWSATSADGSPAIKRLRVARGLPPLKLAAKVSGAGARRVLSWKGSGLAGQSVQFVERSGGGAHVLTTTKRAAGTLGFRPDPQLGRKRTIEAIAFNGATPRSTATVARYTVSAPPKPKRVTGLKLRKGVLTWRAQPGARYEVALIRADGTTATLSARRAKLKLSGLPTKGTARVSIVAVNALGKTGPVTSAKLKIG
jgi:hypothetical protein